MNLIDKLLRWRNKVTLREGNEYEIDSWQKINSRFCFYHYYYPWLKRSKYDEYEQYKVGIGKGF